MCVHAQRCKTERNQIRSDLCLLWYKLHSYLTVSKPCLSIQYRMDWQAG